MAERKAIAKKASLAAREAKRKASKKVSESGLTVLLGNGVVLKYIHRGINQPVHSIDSGTVERDGHGGLKVRRGKGVVVERLSVSHLRSWRIIGPDGVSIDWDISPGDDERLR